MWQCSGCGEAIEPAFDTCWNCGSARDGAPATREFALHHDEVQTDLVAYEAAETAALTGVAAAGLGHNRIYSVNLTGGIIGLLGVSHQAALAKAVTRANADGYEAVFILRDGTNLLRQLLYAIILVCTLFIWCPSPGYLVVGRRVVAESA